MGKKPWMKFYPADWRSDPRLRTCSIAARGLWIEMIAIAHEATPYGHVLIHGKAPDLAALSRVVGVGEAECRSLIEELSDNGVFSQTRNGTFYSRRMVRDEKRSKEGQKSVKKRWAQHHENKQENVVPIRYPSSPPNTKRLETRDQKEKIPKKDFDDFWDICPRKIGKGQARKAYATARSKTDKETIIAGMRRYSITAKGTETKFIAHPATWLNGERWDDEEADSAKGNGSKW